MSHPRSKWMSLCVLCLILSSGCTKEPEHAVEAPPATESKGVSAPVANPGTAEVPTGVDSDTRTSTIDSNEENHSDAEKDKTPDRASDDAATETDAGAPQTGDESPVNKPSPIKASDRSKSEVDDKEEEDE